MVEHSQGGIWSARAVIEQNPIGADESIKQVFLAHGRFASVNVVQRHAEGPAGQGIFLHTHNDHDETVVIISAGDAETMEFQIGDRKVQAKAGDVIFVPAGLPHGPSLDTPGTTMSVSIYGPTFDPDNPDRQMVNP